MGALGALASLWSYHIACLLGPEPARCTPGAVQWTTAVTLLQGRQTFGQPPEVLGNWPPNWYIQGQAMAAPLLESGSDPNDLMGFLYALIQSREDDHYSGFVYDLTADVEQWIGGNLVPANEVCQLSPEEMRWCRYIEEHFHLEYLEAYYPHQQVALENQAGTLPHEFFNLQPPPEGETEPEAVRRVEFNDKRRYSRLMRVVLQLPCPGDSSASSGEETSMWCQAHPLLEAQRSQRTAPARAPMRTLHQIKVRWMQQVMDHLREVHYEGHDGWSYEMLRRRILGRAEAQYRNRAMAYLDSIGSVIILADTFGTEPPDYVQDWAIQVEASLYRILSIMEPCHNHLGETEATSSWQHAGVTHASTPPGTATFPTLCATSTQGISQVMEVSSSNSEGTDSDVIEVISLHDDTQGEDDEICSLMAGAPINKKWLKGRTPQRRRTTRRRRSNPRHTGPRTTVTTEVRRLTSACDSATSSGAAPSSSVGSGRGRLDPHTRVPPKPKARPALARPARPAPSEPARPPPTEVQRPLTIAEAVDLWLVLLGMQDENAPTGAFPTTYQCNVISETFLDQNWHDRVVLLTSLTRVTQRILEVVSNLVQLAMDNEGSQDLVDIEVEADDTNLMQLGPFRTPPSSAGTEQEWLYGLQQLRLSLEAMDQDSRVSMAHLLLKLLDWRTTNDQAGYVLGHATGRASDLLALLTVVHDDVKGRVTTCMPNQDIALQLWNQVSPFLPVAQGSRCASGRGLAPHRPPWVAYATLPEDTPPTSPVSEHPEAGNHLPAPDQVVHGDLPAHVIDGLVEQERQDELEDLAQPPHSQLMHEAEEQAQEQAIREHMLDVQRREGARYQQWEDWVMNTAMTQGPNPRKRKGLQVTLSTATPATSSTSVFIPFSGDSPQVTLQWTMDLPALTQDEPEFPPGQPDSTGPAMIEPVDDESGSLALKPEDLDEVMLQLQRGTLTMAGVLKRYGPDALDMVQLQWAMKDATMQDEAQDSAPSGPATGLPWSAYDAVHTQWVQGLVTDAEVADRLGPEALELFQARRALHEQGTWTQPGGDSHGDLSDAQVQMAVDDLLATGHGPAATVPPSDTSEPETAPFRALSPLPQDAADQFEG
ncbi:unnamed protein product [Symbiodinium sp. CCMP2592]|nr:unnamed protein product [Symbiodinium sp. CCMP2592]